MTKLIVIGDVGTGKTKLCKYLSTQKISSRLNPPTIGIQLFKTKMKEGLDLWDTSGCLKYEPILLNTLSSMLTPEDRIIILYDKETFKRAMSLKHKVNVKLNDVQSYVVLAEDSYFSGRYADVDVDFDFDFDFVISLNTGKGIQHMINEIYR